MPRLLHRRCEVRNFCILVVPLTTLTTVSALAALSRKTNDHALEFICIPVARLATRVLLTGSQELAKREAGLRNAQPVGPQGCRQRFDNASAGKI
jgi:hypothetical protein